MNALRNMIPGTVFTVALLGVYSGIQLHDADVTMRANEQARSQRPICAAKDHLGRHLVASYYAYSDVIQTKRCTYARRISA